MDQSIVLTLLSLSTGFHKHYKMENPSCSAFIIIHLTPKAIMDIVINKNKPTVVVDPKTFYSEATQFKFSNYDSSYLATERLIQQGHSNIAFYGSDSHSTSFRERHEGFMSCMETHKGHVKPFSIIFDNADILQMIQILT